MNNQNISEYPYGQFPTKFTKHGQQQYFEELTKNQNVSMFNTDYEQQANSKIQSEQNNQTQQNSSFDFSKLLPLIKMMGDKKSISSTDMLQMLLPLIGGGNMSGISEIMNIFNKDKPVEEIEEDVIIDGIKIDDYKRVD